MTDTAKLVEEARALLEAAHVPGPWDLLAEMADALERAGRIEAAARDVVHLYRAWNGDLHGACDALRAALEAK